MAKTKNGKILLAALMLALMVAGFWAMKPRAKVIQSPEREVARHAMIQKDKVWFENGSTNPFTGTMTDSYPNGARLSRCQLANGVLNGISETWYTNGQMQVSEHFKDNISDGLRIKWYENGKKLSEANIVKGKVTGFFQSWYDNGQMAEAIPMKDGQPDGRAQQFYRSGCLQLEVVFNNGASTARQTWRDGEKR